MTIPTVVIVRTGVANLASVTHALARLGAEPVASEDPALVREAPFVVLPGVGAFGPTMRQLRKRGIYASIVDRVRLGLPLLAICLGMQLLCDGSEESDGEPGLGVVNGAVRRFGSGLRVPQVGWNHVLPTAGAVLVGKGDMYFANSYRLESIPAGWEGAIASYGGTFVAALERGPLVACQFHPELSGQGGMNLIRRWLARGATGATC